MIGTIISAGAALLSSAIGKAKSAEENNAARRLIANQRKENRRWYETKMGQDYTLRADVQAAINKQRELLDEQYKRARATNTVAGGTDASLALQRESANRATADTMSNVAANAAEYKDSIEQQYRAQDAALNQQQAQNHQQQAAQISQAASQAVNAGINGVANGLAAKGLKTPTETPAIGPDPRPVIPKTTPVNSDFTPNSIASPSGTVLSPDELPKVRKSNA